MTRARGIAVALELCDALLVKESLRHPRHLRLLKPIQSKVKALVAQYFQHQKKAIVDAVKYRIAESAGSVAALRILPNSVVPLSFPITSAEDQGFADAMRAAIDAGANRLAKDLGATAGLDEPGILNYLKQKSLGKLTGDFSDTTKQRLRTAIATAVDEGKDADGIIDAIKDTMDSFSDYRADMVAQTEVNNAYNHGRTEMAARLGMDQKMWSTESGDPCPICVKNESEGWIPFDQAFSSGDQMPTAHPRCYCSLDYRSSTGEIKQEEPDTANSLELSTKGVADAQGAVTGLQVLSNWYGTYQAYTLARSVYNAARYAGLLADSTALVPLRRVRGVIDTSLASLPAASKLAMLPPGKQQLLLDAANDLRLLPPGKQQSLLAAAQEMPPEPPIINRMSTEWLNRKKAPEHEAEVVMRTMKPNRTRFRPVVIEDEDELDEAFEKFVFMTGMTPQKFSDHVLSNFDEGFFKNPKFVVTMLNDESFEFEFTGAFASGSVAMSRKIVLEDGEKMAFHQYLDVEGVSGAKVQAGGIGKKLFSASLDMYDHLGIDTILVHANIDVGGYAWARYGFELDEAGWKVLASQLKSRLAFRMSDKDNPLDETLVKRITDLLDNKDPRSLQLLAAMKEDVDWTVEDENLVGRRHPIGKAMLIGSDWEGSMNLADKVKYTQVRAYTNTK